MNISLSESPLPSRRTILGLRVCALFWTEAYAFADAIASMRYGQTVISFLNANNANLMSIDPVYRAALDRQIVLPDGHGVDIASWMTCGSMFPANLNGTDFIPGLLTYMSTPRRIAMVGGRPEIVRRAAENFRKHAPWHEFIPVSDGFFPEEASDQVLAKVREAQADILLVAMGSPKQEVWIDKHVGPNHARLVVSVGALFDFVAGEVPRAPVMVRRLRLEWLYRLVQEPKRLWRRYVLGNPAFLYRVLSWNLRHGFSAPSKKSDHRPSVR